MFRKLACELKGLNIGGPQSFRRNLRVPTAGSTTPMDNVFNVPIKKAIFPMKHAFVSRTIEDLSRGVVVD